KTADAISELAVGEALVSTLGPKGVPSIMERTLIRPPTARLGPLSAEERQAIIRNSPLAGRYDTPVDRECAFEMLQKRSEPAQAGPTENAADGGIGAILGSIFGTGGSSRTRLTPGQRMARDVTRTVTN